MSFSIRRQSYSPPLKRSKVDSRAKAYFRFGQRVGAGGGAAPRAVDADHRGPLRVDKLDYGIEPETADQREQPTIVDYRDIEAFALAADIHPDPACHDESIPRCSQLIQVTTG